MNDLSTRILCDVEDSTDPLKSSGSVSLFNAFSLALISVFTLRNIRFEIPRLCCAVIIVLASISVQAAAPFLDGLLVNLVDENAGVRKNAIDTLVRTGDVRVERLLEYFRLGSFNRWNGKPVVYEDTVENEDFDEFALLLDPLSGNPILGADGNQIQVLTDDLEEISPNRQERQYVRSAGVLLRLSSPDRESRLGAVKKAGQPPRNVAAAPFLEEIARNDTDETIRVAARESLFLIQFTESTPEHKVYEKWAAAESLGRMKSMRALPVLEEALQNPDIDLKAAETCRQAVDRIKAHQRWVNRVGNVVQGLSLGSVLILMALGLAITFGLMGVINMAHGELMMIGAYTTYEMQRLFHHSPDNPANIYYLAALPASFLSAAAVGILIELLVVRHLYRRPLESLLATWGVGLILIQLVRVRYGDNIGINAPSWARGGIEVTQDVIIPYARIYFFAICSACVGIVYFIMKRTSLGMNMKATMQNRDMASSLGVNTKRVDLCTFALGSGVAGVAGYAWTIIGGVTPDMGQQIFIVDSFLVVVTGGVGELAGVICSGLGIGMLTKFIEPIEIGGFLVGPVWAKIILLIAIVAFIQFKPAGLFAPKGRLSDV